MTVSKFDVEWIVNLRKSIANLFFIRPIRENYAAGEEQQPILRIDMNRKETEAYSIYEPSIFGRCLSQYTLTSHPSPLKILETQSMMSKMKSDYNLEGNKPFDIYQMKRSINFDNCTDQVILQVGTVFTIFYVNILLINTL